MFFLFSLYIFFPYTQETTITESHALLLLKDILFYNKYIIVFKTNINVMFV